MKIEITELVHYEPTALIWGHVSLHINKRYPPCWLLHKCFKWHLQLFTIITRTNFFNEVILGIYTKYTKRDKCDY